MGEAVARGTATACGIASRRQWQEVLRLTTGSGYVAQLNGLSGPTRSCPIGEPEASVKAASPRSGSSAARALTEPRRAASLVDVLALRRGQVGTSHDAVPIVTICLLS